MNLENIRKFIEELANLYIIGYINDIILLKGTNIAIHFSDVNNVDEIMNYIVNEHYGAVSIKPTNKLHYKTIYLHKFDNFKLNRKSITIKQKPNYTGSEYVNTPDIRINL